MFGRCFGFCSFCFGVCHGPPWAKRLLLGLDRETLYSREDRPGARGDSGGDLGDGTFLTLLARCLCFRALMQQEFLAFACYRWRIFQVSVLAVGASIITGKFRYQRRAGAVPAGLPKSLCVSDDTQCRFGVFLLTDGFKCLVIKIKRDSSSTQMPF